MQCVTDKGLRSSESCFRTVRSLVAATLVLSVASFALVFEGNPIALLLVLFVLYDSTRPLMVPKTIYSFRRIGVLLAAIASILSTALFYVFALETVPLISGHAPPAFESVAGAIAIQILLAPFASAVLIRKKVRFFPSYLAMLFPGAIVLFPATYMLTVLAYIVERRMRESASRASWLAFLSYWVARDGIVTIKSPGDLRVGGFVPSNEELADLLQLAKDLGFAVVPVVGENEVTLSEVAKGNYTSIAVGVNATEDELVSLARAFLESFRGVRQVGVSEAVKVLKGSIQVRELTYAVLTVAVLSYTEQFVLVKDKFVNLWIPFTELKPHELSVRLEIPIKEAGEILNSLKSLREDERAIREFLAEAVEYGFVP